MYLSSADSKHHRGRPGSRPRLQLFERAARDHLGARRGRGSFAYRTPLRAVRPLPNRQHRQRALHSIYSPFCHKSNNHRTHLRPRPDRRRSRQQRAQPGYRRRHIRLREARHGDELDLARPTDRGSRGPSHRRRHSSDGRLEKGALDECRPCWSLRGRLLVVLPGDLQGGNPEAEGCPAKERDWQFGAQIRV